MTAEHRRLEENRTQTADWLPWGFLLPRVGSVTVWLYALRHLGLP
jgi:hypothetical protein